MVYEKSNDRGLVGSASSLVDRRSILESFELVMVNAIILIGGIINIIYHEEININIYLLLIFILAIIKSYIDTTKFNNLIKTGNIYRAPLNDERCGGVIISPIYMSGNYFRINRLECLVGNRYIKKVGIILRIDFIRETGYVFVMWDGNKCYMFYREVVFSEEDIFKSGIDKTYNRVLIGVNILMMLISLMVLYI